MPGQPAGMFDSLRQLLRTGVALGHARLELLVFDLEIEKRRIVDVALLALVGLTLLALGLVLLIGLLLMLVGENQRTLVLAALCALCVGAGLALIFLARQRLQRGEPILALSKGELARDRAALENVDRPA
ncbi:MAG: phage holin family protein [Rubrivivax sp.]